MKKKLMVVAPYFYPKIGGMENYAWNISKGLKEKYGWDVVVITSNHEEKKYKEEFIKGIKIYRLPIMFKISNTPINPMWYFDIKKIIYNEKPDIINAHTPVPFMADVSALVIRDIPFIVTYHSGSMLKNKLLTDIPLYIYEKIFLKLILNKAKRIMGVSEFVFNNILKNYKSKTSIITPGVNVNLFKPNNKNEIRNKKNILIIGGLSKAEDYKRVIDVIHAVKLLRERKINACLKIIGNGDNVNYFKGICKELGISEFVDFKGIVMGNNLVKEYQSADVVCLASVNESFGMVLIEAMACKKPVIGTRVGGIQYVIEDGVNGLLVEPKNPIGLAEAILKILSDEKLARRMGENGYKKVSENFTWDKQAKKIKNLFNQA